MLLHVCVCVCTGRVCSLEHCSCSHSGTAAPSQLQHLESLDFALLRPIIQTPEFMNSAKIEDVLRSIRNIVYFNYIFIISCYYNIRVHLKITMYMRYFYCRTSLSWAHPVDEQRLPNSPNNLPKVITWSPFADCITLESQTDTSNQHNCTGKARPVWAIPNEIYYYFAIVVVCLFLSRTFYALRHWIRSLPTFALSRWLLIPVHL